MIANISINPQRYSQLLSRVLPTVITSAEEHERALQCFDELFHKESLAKEEEVLFELLITLIEKYEKEQIVDAKVTPLGMLKFLMAQTDKKAKDLWLTLGSKGRVSDILNGKREITLAQAKLLGKFFSVSPMLFIDIED